MTTIDGIGGTGGPGGPGRPGDPGKPGKAEGRKAADEAGGDRLQLSADARRVAALGEAARRLPDIRAERVETLRQAIAEGRYAPDPRGVARAILEFEDGLPF